MANRKNKYTTTVKSSEVSNVQRLGLLALGSICLVYTARQYTLTVIPFDYIIYFFICIGVFASLLSYKLLACNSNSSKILLQNFLLRTLFFGIFLTPLFLLINTYLPNKEPYHITTSIKEKHKRSSYRTSPYVVVEVEGLEKKIYINEHPFEELATKNNITLQLRKGFLGFSNIDYERIQIDE